LGWNIEDPDEVSAEETISKKRVDFGFRLDGIPKFFLETKKLSEDVEQHSFFEQAINYSWHKGCTYAVLTNFRTLYILNAEWNTDKLIDSRIIVFQHSDYISRFDELWLLSKDSFKEGLLDKFAESRFKKRTRRAIDNQLLSDMIKFREMLSKDIVKNNQDRLLSEADVEEIVQRIIDRLIFIRNAEDREYAPILLLSKIREWEDARKGRLVEHIRQVYKKFDDDYNSKLFAPHACDVVVIDNDALKTVIKGLYFTSDNIHKYDFSIIDADILGRIYEQYLGAILHKTQKRTTLEESPNRRKEQGIYYTPPYIVDYIIKSTLGELLKSKAIDVESIKILDPACGSGSFLIKAFDAMNSHYAKSMREQQSKLAKGGDYYSTKLNILINNIFGVDLDKQAIEITQLNLLLRLAEKGHRLPLLQKNIKCGNSLISDKSFDPKAFEWNNEFKEIIDNGGFDVIIGNPPYVRQEEFLPIKDYLKQNFETYHSMADLFVYFFERGLKLLKENGYFGMIVSNKWLKTGYGLPLRKFLNQYWIEQFIDFGDLNVFQDATTYPCIIIMRKRLKPNRKIKACEIKSLNFESLQKYIDENSYSINQEQLNYDNWNFKINTTIAILDKIRSESTLLKEYINDEVYFGIKTGLSKAFIIDAKTYEKMIKSDPNSNEVVKPFLKGNDVRRYALNFKNKYIILTKIGVQIQKYPAVLEWLLQFKSELENRWDKGNVWYELRTCTYYDLFTKPKLIYGAITTQPRFTIDYKGYYANNANFFIPSTDKNLLGILNSKLGWFLIANTCTKLRGGYQLIWKYFGNVPIIKKRSPELEKMVDEMLKLHDALSSTTEKSDESEHLKTKITALDKKIDELVYRLYELTPEEIAIIERTINPGQPPH